MLDLLILRDAQGVEHIDQTLGAEQPHEVVLQGNIKFGFPGISLTSGTSPQLIVDPPGLVTLGADNLKTARLSGEIVQLDIRTAAGHVGGDGNRPVNAGVRHDLRLQLVELGV